MQTSDHPFPESLVSCQYYSLHNIEAGEVGSRDISPTCETICLIKLIKLADWHGLWHTEQVAKPLELTLKPNTGKTVEAGWSEA